MSTRTDPTERDYAAAYRMVIGAFNLSAHKLGIRQEFRRMVEQTIWEMADSPFADWASSPVVRQQASLAASIWHNLAPDPDELS